MTFDVAVLVSVGRHPVSGRARRADCDARAVELALNLRERWGVRLHAVHAGNADEPALRDYLGMGVPELTVLELPSEADPLPALSVHLRMLRPLMILSGVQAEHGLASGQLPYTLAGELDCPIVSEIVEIVPAADCADLCQALPRGRRRAVRVCLPAIIGVAGIAPSPRPTAFGRARRGLIVRRKVPGRLHTPAPVWSQRPARARPIRSPTPNGVGAVERLRAIREASASHGQVLENPSPAEAARVIHAFLLDAGILKA